MTGPAAILFDQIPVRELSLRVFIQILHVAVRRCVVEIKVIFLNVLAVIAFGGHEAECALFQDRIAPVPEREGEDKQLVSIADSGHPVFAPSICSAASHVVGEVIPGVAVGAVVFADGSPRALGYVRSPKPPGRCKSGILFESRVLLSLGRNLCVWIVFHRYLGGTFGDAGFELNEKWKMENRK